MDTKRAQPFRAAPPPPLPPRGNMVVSDKLKEAASILSQSQPPPRQRPISSYSVKVKEEKQSDLLVDLLSGENEHAFQTPSLPPPSAPPRTGSSLSKSSSSGGWSLFGTRQHNVTAEGGSNLTNGKSKKKPPPPRPPPPKLKAPSIDSGMGGSPELLVDLLGSDGASIHSSGSDGPGGTCSLFQSDNQDPFSPVSWGKTSMQSQSHASFPPPSASSPALRTLGGAQPTASSSVLKDLKEIFESSSASSNGPSFPKRASVYENRSSFARSEFSSTTSSGSAGVSSVATSSTWTTQQSVKRGGPTEESLIASASNAVSDLPKWKPTVIRPARGKGAGGGSSTPTPTSSSSPSPMADLPRPASWGTSLSHAGQQHHSAWNNTESWGTGSSQETSGFSVAKPSLPPRPKTDDVPYAVAIYEYDSGVAGDLAFQAGESILLHHYVNEEWLEGSCQGKTGIFPTNFVQVEVPITDEDAVVSVFEFTSEIPEDLPFPAGVVIHVTEMINSEWLKGSYQGFQGQFPVTFVSHIPKRFRSQN